MRIRPWLRARHRQLREHRLLLGIAVVALVVLLLFFGAQLYLYTRLLLGNDIVLRLESNDTALFLQNGEAREVEYKTSALANPFCAATCDLRLEDVSGGRIADEQRATLRTGSPITARYTVRAPSEGHGLRLYRFRASCTSAPTLLCHTSGVQVQRTELLPVVYNLSDEQAILKERARTQLEQIAARQRTLALHIEELELLRGALEDVAAAPVVVFPHPELLEQDIASLNVSWSAERYTALLEQENVTTRMLDEQEAQAESANEVLTDAARTYNHLLERLRIVGEHLAAQRALPIFDTQLADLVREAIAQHNEAQRLVVVPSDLADREQIIGALEEAYARLAPSLEQHQRAQAMRIAVENEIARDVLCRVGGQCGPPAQLEQIAASPPWIGDTCAQREELVSLIAASSQHDGADVERNASALINATRNQIVAEVLSSINGTVAAQLAQHLFMVPAPNATLPNASGALLRALARSIPSCEMIGGPAVAPQQHSPIDMPKLEASPAVPAQDPPAQCCAHGACQRCCEECSGHHYPVLFLHGHAFNEGTLADYSLDAFNAIQQRLERDGYIDAGAISLYTQGDVPGILGSIPAPVSLKASYYFDLYKQPHDYILVQAKSESIDTYAIRLHDLIGIATGKTGKQQVIIVAHSMGGIVARRYIQIFGPDHVRALIMIGTPNQGISERTASWCDVIGEQLECRDMREDSLAINKINQAPIQVPTYNIVGRGCDMDGEDGDGVVTVESAMLEHAQTMLVNGSCKGISILHTGILDISRYPETYEMLRQALSQVQQ